MIKNRTSHIAVGIASGLLMITLAGCSGVAGAAPNSGSTPTAGQSPGATPSTGAGTPSAAPSSAGPSSGGSASPGSPTPTAARTKPTRGSVTKTVPRRTVHTARPVDLGKKDGRFATGGTARITGLRQQYVKAKIPGQLSGASVVFDLMIKNGSQKALDLNATTVNLLDAKGAPAPAITTEPATRLPNVLDPGATATATYVFIVPKSARNPVDVDVTINAELDVVVFHGNAG